MGGARDAAGERRRGAVADGLVHRRDAVRDVLRPRSWGRQAAREESGVADDADRRAKLDVRELGRRRGFRRRRGERAVRLGPRRRDRFREQDDEAGHELLDDVPPIVGGSPGGDGPARGVPVDGQVGRGQPTVRRQGVEAVDPPDVPRRRAPERARPTARSVGGPRPDRPERTGDHRRRRSHRAPPGDDAVLRPDRER